MESNRVAKASIGYTIGNYLIKGLAFLTLPIFARIMSTEDFGLYNTFVAYEGILLYLIGLGVDTSFKSARFRYGYESEVAEGKPCYEGYVSTAVSIVFANAIIWLLLLFAFREKATGLLGLDFASSVMLVFFSLSNAIILCYNSHASLSYNYIGYVRIGAINAVCSIALSIALILWVFPDKTYLGRMLGATSVITVLAIYIWISFIKNHKPDNLKEYAGWGLRYSLPIVPHGISQIILVNFDRIMIMHMIGNAEAGIYSFAYNIFAIVYVTYRSLDPVWSTWFYERMNRGAEAEIRRYSSLYMTVMLAISSVIILVSPELVLVLGSAKYKAAVYCVIPIVAGGFFTFLYSIPCQVEYYREKTGFIAGATMCAAGINIVLNLFFIRKYGYVAAAYTTLVTYVLYFLFHLLLAKKIEGKNLFSTKTIAFCSIAVLCVSAAAIININHLFFRAMLGLAIIAVFLLFVQRQYPDMLNRFIKIKTK